MESTITFDNLHSYTIPFEGHPLNWKFGVSKNNKLEDAFKSEIIPLNIKASRFLRAYRNSQRILNDVRVLPNYYNTVTELAALEEQKVTQWLHKKQVKLDDKVFWVAENRYGFILTWRVLIKFWDYLFVSDEVFWPIHLNWVLHHDHEDVLYFAEDKKT